MIALRATVRPRADVHVQPLLLNRLRQHRNIRIDEHTFLALVPGAGSVIVTRRIGQLLLDLVVDRRELMPVVIAGLEAELRRGGAAERIAIEWTSPDRVPVPLR
ncbi:hypothetical protein HQQ81_16230 [Microbacteriaceae bacterium VKM Ac-2854]|nr:hypothetical protein [Microbacteriaceae bacterium VKM Ac-2854]